MNLPKLVAGLVVFAVLASGAASAAGLGPVAGPDSIGQSSEPIYAPPVSIAHVQWNTQFRNGVGYVIDSATVTYQFTDDFNGRLGFYVELSGNAPLPLGSNQDQDLDVGSGDLLPLHFSFHSANVPAESLEDIHFLVCSDVDSKPPNVCAIVP